jgi:hypothetical protein
VTTLALTLQLAVAFLSPAALLTLAPRLLADGTRGPWATVTLASGAVLVALVLAEPWSRRLGSGTSLVEVTAERWPAPGFAQVPLALAESLGVLLFVWAQLAAVRVLTQALGGWPRTAVAGLALMLAVLSGPRRLRSVTAAIGAAAAVLGLGVPLGAVLFATTPVWPRVWADVGSRPRVTFSEKSPWVVQGGPIRTGDASANVLEFTEEQQVTVLGPGAVRLELWEGGTGRDAPRNTELTLRGGDRLVVQDGTWLRFQAARRIPGAPVNGPDWVSPPRLPVGAAALAGLGVTLAAGAFGLPAAAAALGRGAAGIRAARLGAGLVLAGAAGVLLWALYAAWLTPEIYMGGVAGTEVYALPARVPALGAAGDPLRLLALAGLVAGGVAAALAALGGVAPVDREAVGPSRAPVAALGLGAGALAVLTPAGPWPVLVAAFALGASALAPPAVLVGWSARVTPRSLAAGATVGLTLFAGLSLVALWGRIGASGPPSGSTLAALLAWPALVALPANFLIAWLGTARAAPSAGSPLAAGFAGLREGGRGGSAERPAV